MPSYDTISLHPQDHLLSQLDSTVFDVICIGSGWAGRILAAGVVKAGLTAVISKLVLLRHTFSIYWEDFCLLSMDFSRGPSDLALWLFPTQSWVLNTDDIPPTVEEQLVGGDCPFWACVPSKALLRPQEALAEASAVAGVRELQRENPSLDAGTVFKRRDAFTSSWHDSEVLVPMVENSGAALVRGRGKLVGVKRVAVTHENGQSAEFEARHAVAICTGSDPIIPNIPGLKESNPWGPRQATSSSEVPKHLLVLGAGAVGTEMATVYASLGGQVSLVSRGAELLPKVDPEAGRLVREGLESQGVRVYTSITVESVAREEPGDSLVVQLSNGSKISGVTRILAATGRKANTSGIGLENFGIETHGSPISVSESLDVPSVPGRWLYALGDVNGRAPMSHSSKYHGRIAAKAIIARSQLGETDEPGLSAPWSKISATNDILAQPQVVFTRPTVASVGLTRRGAEAAGSADKIRVVTAPVATLGAKLHQEGYKDGWAQWIIDMESNKLVGATFVGDGVAELLHASTVAIVGGVTLDMLAHAVPPFPTMSEVYLNLLEAAEGL